MSAAARRPAATGVTGEPPHVPGAIGAAEALERLAADARVDPGSRDDLRHAAAVIRDLEERGRLLERLARISRSISHRAPLQEVLDAITAGAAELLGDAVVGIRLIDPEDEGMLTLVSSSGVRPELLDALRRGPVGEGTGGRAIAEGRLVVMDDYSRSPDALPVFARDGLQAAMGAPVCIDGRIAGSLVVASYEHGRHYSAVEQEALVDLADRASLALTDARTVAAMRAAEESKDLFLAMVSHELKTPLTVVLGTLSTVQHHGDRLSPERRAALLAAATERGRQLERLIDGLLQGARGELATQREDVSLPDLLARAVRGFDETGRLDVLPAPDVALHVDATAVTDTVGILLENAISHGPADCRIRVATLVEGREVFIAVENPGDLPAELSPAQLFAPFQRGPDSRSSGVGLGLYIAAKLAGSLGGRVLAASTSGTVTFTLAFPLAEATPA